MLKRDRMSGNAVFSVNETPYFLEVDALLLPRRKLSLSVNGLYQATISEKKLSEFIDQCNLVS